MITKLHPLKIYQNAINRKRGCLFCKPVEGMPIEETENFRVLIDTFPILPGHLMISSKSHFGSAGEIPEDLQQELNELKELLKHRVQKVSGDYIFYEHGRSGCCMSINPLGDRCEHFHLHCLPTNISIVSNLIEKFPCIHMKSYFEISRLYNEHGSYLYFEDKLGNMFFFPAEDSKVPSHLLRTLVCLHQGFPQRAKWQEYNESDVFLKSYELVDELIYADWEGFNL